MAERETKFSSMANREINFLDGKKGSTINFDGKQGIFSLEKGAFIPGVSTGYIFSRY